MIFSSPSYVPPCYRVADGGRVCRSVEDRLYPCHVAGVPDQRDSIEQDTSLIVRPFRCDVQLSKGGNTLSYNGRGSDRHEHQPIISGAHSGPMGPTPLTGKSRTARLGPLLSDACAAIRPFSLMASAPMSRQPAAPESRVFRSIIVVPLYRKAVISAPIWATPTT